MTRDEFDRRRADYERFRWIASVIGAAPLLSMYALLHTPYLRAFLPDSKLLSVFVLFFVPLGWFFAAMRSYAWWGARHFGLQCPRCGASLVNEASRQGVKRDACRSCGTKID